MVIVMLGYLYVPRWESQVRHAPDGSWRLPLYDSIAERGAWGMADLLLSALARLSRRISVVVWTHCAAGSRHN